MQKDVSCEQGLGEHSRKDTVLLFIGTRAAAATHQTKQQTWLCWFVHLIVSVRAALFRSASDEVKLEPHRRTRVGVREREIIIGSMAPYAWIEITTPSDRVPVSRHSRRKDINSRECHSNSKVDNRPRRSVCAARFEVQVVDVPASLGKYNLPLDRL